MKRFVPRRLLLVLRAMWSCVLADRVSLDFAEVSLLVFSELTHSFTSQLFGDCVLRARDAPGSGWSVVSKAEANSSPRGIYMPVGNMDIKG